MKDILRTVLNEFYKPHFFVSKEKNDIKSVCVFVFPF